MFTRLRRVVGSVRGKKSESKGILSPVPQRGLHESRPTGEATANTVDPYSYTSGRWLKQDALQREARYMRFDFPALCRKVVEACPGAQEVVRYEKKEGSFNRVFILHLDNGQRAVARIPFPISGPRRLATHSEVASMVYLRSHSKIPVPKILGWSDDENNPTGTEYMIMEHAPGVQLHERWPSMNTHQHMLCVKSLAKLVKEMAHIKFPAYGSLYFADAPIDSSAKIDFVDGFCVGPHCGAPAWPCSPVEFRSYDERMSNRGPWTDLQSYCSGLIETGIARLPRVEPQSPELSYRGTVSEHLHLLKISDEVIKELIRNPIFQRIADPMLLHPDLNKRNIYVSETDPTQITALIDWQSVSIEPTFSYANEVPDLVTAPTSMPTPLEEAIESGGNEPDAETRKLQKDVEICRQTFEVGIRGWVPKFYEARAADETLLRVIRYCSTSWRISAAALQHELIELSQRWSELGLAGSCPYQPTADELRKHEKEYEDFETFQQLKLFIVRATNSNSDGWVPPEAWDDTREAHRMAFEDWMDTTREVGEMSEEKARRLWPFDVD